MFEPNPSNLPDERPTSTLGSFKAMLNRWRSAGGSAQAASDPGSMVKARARHPGAKKPVWIEVSPGSADPFPETKTMPSGWDLSEMLKS